MKNKIIIAIILLVTLSVSLNADSSNEKWIRVNGYIGNIKSVWFNNNEYVICHVGFGEAGVIMRNKTKDDLEIELLKLQIKELKSRVK